MNPVTDICTFMDTLHSIGTANSKFLFPYNVPNCKNSNKYRVNTYCLDVHTRNE